MLLPYETLEESFPILREQREVEEELRRLELTHAHLQENERITGSPSLEYMQADDSSSDDSGESRDSDNKYRHAKIDMSQRRKRNTKPPATMDDLPKEDMFGFTKPPPRKAKTFPGGGRRLGREFFEPRNIEYAMNADIDFETACMCMLLFLLTLFMLRDRILHRRLISLTKELKQVRDDNAKSGMVLMPREFLYHAYQNSGNSSSNVAAPQVQF